MTVFHKDNREPESMASGKFKLWEMAYAHKDC